MDPLRILAGKKIKEFRERHGLTQKELADAAVISDVTLHMIEKGKTATNLDVIERIAHQLGVTASDLLSAQTVREAPSADEATLAKIRRLTPVQRDLLDQFLDKLLARAAPKRSKGEAG